MNEFVFKFKVLSNYPGNEVRLIRERGGRLVLLILNGCGTLEHCFNNFLGIAAIQFSGQILLVLCDAFFDLIWGELRWGLFWCSLYQANFF